MKRDTCWLPKLELMDDYDNNWKKYQEALYEIFKYDFMSSKPKFEGIPVNIRKHPIEYGREEAFFHITCQDYMKNGERVPDFRRCERIRWVKAFIENNNCDSDKIPHSVRQDFVIVNAFHSFAIEIIIYILKGVFT